MVCCIVNVIAAGTGSISPGPKSPQHGRPSHLAALRDLSLIDILDGVLDFSKLLLQVIHPAIEFTFVGFERVDVDVEMLRDRKGCMAVAKEFTHDSFCQLLRLVVRG